MPEQDNNSPVNNSFEAPKVDLSKPAFDNQSTSSAQAAAPQADGLSHQSYFGPESSDSVTPKQEMIYDSASNSGGNKKLIIIIAASVAGVLILGGVVGAILSLSKPKTPAVQEEAPALTEDSAEPADDGSTASDENTSTTEEETSTKDEPTTSDEATTEEESTVTPEEETKTPVEQNIVVPVPAEQTPAADGSVQVNG